MITALEIETGKRLTVAREALGLTPDQLAERLGMSRRAYLAWEHGKRQRWTGMLIKLFYRAEVPISADYLICGDYPMFFEPDQMRKILERYHAGEA